MILALNANAAIDRVLFIDRFLPGGVMRPNRSVLSVGGKSLDAAVVIKTMGGSVEAVSFIAGENGKTLQGLLDNKGIPCDLIWLAGDTRVSYVIVEMEYNRHSHITTSGYQVSVPDCDLFLERVKHHAPGASWAILAGSLPGGAPANFYCQQIELLHQFGVKTLIDTSAQAALGALPASPDIVKMNQAEFCATFPAQAASLKDADQQTWIQACREVIRMYKIQNFVLTCGKDGILALTRSATYHASAPLMEEVNAAGSGDAVSGTLAYRLSLGDPWEEALRWSAAAGAAVVLTEGTAECCLHDVLNIFPQTQVRSC